MKRIYLDQNIWIDLQMGRGLVSLIKVLEKINRDEVEIVFSPANIEEIYHSYSGEGRKGKYIGMEDRDKRLDILAEVTQCKEIIPYPNGFNVLHSLHETYGPYIIRENPIDCYKRIMDFYPSNTYAIKSQKKTIDISVGVDKGLKSKIGNKDFLDILKTDQDLMDMLLDKITINLIKKVAIDTMVARRMTIQPWNEEKNNYLIGMIEYILSNDINGYQKLALGMINNTANINIALKGFTVCEAVVEALMLTMLEYGFSPEKDSTSSLHDTTHAIYGSYCNFFVCRDAALMKKSKYIFKFLNSGTEIIDANNEDWSIYLQ